MPSKNTTIDTILFDLDGTLVDTELAAAKAIHGCFENWGIAIDATDASYITGRTWATAFDFFFSKYRLPIARLEAERQMLLAYENSLETHLTFVPGGAEAVRSLAGRYKLALVSGSNVSQIHFALDRLGVRAHFDVILGAENYGQSKPSPEGYLKALSLLDRQAHRSLVFEDSDPGIASGLAAGAWVVAITGTNHFLQDNSRAHHRIEDLTPVKPAWIEELAAKLLRAE